MFCNPDQQLIQLLLRREITAFNTCNVKCVVPPPDALPRSKNTGVTITGTAFNDPLLGTFILFPRTTNSIIMSSDILIQFKTAEVYSNLNVSYLATTSDNGPVTIRFYSYDNILGLTMPDSLNERYWLVPDILNGKLTEYHTRSGMFTVPCILNMLIKVSSNVTSLQVTFNYVPSERLFPCPGILYDSRGCPAMEYTYEDPLLLRGIPLGMYERRREELIAYLQETSLGLLLPLIPPSNEVNGQLADSSNVALQQHVQVFTSPMALICLIITPEGVADHYITSSTKTVEEDPNWADPVSYGGGPCNVLDANLPNPVLTGYRIIPDTSTYKLVVTSIQFTARPGTTPELPITLRIRYTQGNLSTIAQTFSCPDRQPIDADLPLGILITDGQIFHTAVTFPMTQADLVTQIYREPAPSLIGGDWDVIIESGIEGTSRLCP